MITLSRTVWLVVALAWLWLFGVVVHSSGNSDFNLFTFLCLAGFLLAIVWIIISSLNWANLWKSARKRWLSVPLAGALGLVFIISSDWLLMARVKLCEDRLSSYVAGIAPGTDDRQTRWVGLMRVQETKECEGGVYLYTGNEFLDRVGLAYLPPGARPAGRIRVQHLYGPWYSFVWHF